MSKLLILSAGVSEDSNNTKLAKKLNKFLDEKSVPNEIHENLYENIPFLLDNQKDVPKKILEMRKSLENSDKIIIDIRFNGGGQDAVTFEILKRFNEMNRHVASQKLRDGSSFTNIGSLVYDGDHGSHISADNASCVSDRDVIIFVIKYTSNRYLG